MSSRVYRQRSRDGRPHHRRYSNRRPRLNQVSKRRLPGHGTYSAKLTSQRSNDFSSTADAEDGGMEMMIAADASTTSLHSGSSDHDGTPIPDHVWVGEYLDDGEDKDTVPLTYDSFAKEIVHNKSLSEAASPVQDLMTSGWMPSNFGRSSPSAMLELLRRKEGLIAADLIPPLMGQSQSIPTTQELKTYRDLYRALIDSIAYRAESSSRGSELLKHTQSKPMPAEVYDYAHGEKRATTSRAKRERKRSSEAARYSRQSRDSLRSTSQAVVNKRKQTSETRLEDSEKTKYKALVYPSNADEETGQKKSVAEDSSQRLAMTPSPTSMTFQEIFQEIQTNKSKVPDASNTLSKRFTFQELCELRKALARPSTSIQPSETDRSFIPVHTSHDKSSQKSSHEGFPIKVLTSHRRRPAKDEEEDEFPCLPAAKSGEGRQPVAQVTPLRIKPILKKVSRDVKVDSASSMVTSGRQEQHYSQSSSFRGNFNDTRKVLLDAAKELDKRAASKDPDKGPRIVLRNAALQDDIMMRESPERIKRLSTLHNDEKEPTESVFPFRANPNDSGKKSDDSDDDEADKRRYERLFAKCSPTSGSGRFIRSRSNSSSLSSERHSPSFAPETKSHERRHREVIETHLHSRERDHTSGGMQRLVLPPDSSEDDRMGIGQKPHNKGNKVGCDEQRKTPKDNFNQGRGRSHATRSHGKDSFNLGMESSRQRRYSPSVKGETDGKKRNYGQLSNRERNSKVGLSLHERSQFHEGRSSSSGNLEKSVSRSRREVRSSDLPKGGLFQISLPTGGKHQISGVGQGVPTGEHEKNTPARKRSLLPERQGSPFSHIHSDTYLGQLHQQQALLYRQAQIQILSSMLRNRSVSMESKETEDHDILHNPVRRFHRSKSRSTEKSALQPPKRKRGSGSPLWVDKSESFSLGREVHRERRYQHEKMDSILQEEEIPRLLDIEITPLPSLMDVDVSAKPDVKVRDERRFASRSASKERLDLTEHNKVKFEERQKKKIVTNPTGKIVLKRRVNITESVKDSQPLSKTDPILSRPIISSKAAKTHPEGIGTVEKPKQFSTIENVKGDLLKTPKLSEAKKASKILQPTEAHQSQPALDIVSGERLRQNEWIEDYKKWFQCTMNPILSQNERATELGLQDPIDFLERVTKGNRRMLSFVPRGTAAKEILKFIALNRTSKKPMKLVRKEEDRAATEVKTPSGDRDVQRNNPDDSSPASGIPPRRSHGQGNEFFVIDKKPSGSEVLTSIKKTDQATDEKAEVKLAAVSRSKSLDKRETARGAAVKSKNIVGISRSSLSTEDNLKEKESLESPQIPQDNKPRSSSQSRTHDHGEEPILSDLVSPADVLTTRTEKKEELGLAVYESCQEEAGAKKFRSWQDALLFPADENDGLYEDISTTSSQTETHLHPSEIESVDSPGSLPGRVSSEFDLPLTSSPSIHESSFSKPKYVVSTKQPLSPAHSFTATSSNTILQTRPPLKTNVSNKKDSMKNSLKNPLGKPYSKKTSLSKNTTDKREEKDVSSSKPVLPESGYRTPKSKSDIHGQDSNQTIPPRLKLPGSSNAFESHPKRAVPEKNRPYPFGKRRQSSEQKPLRKKSTEKFSRRTDHSIQEKRKPSSASMVDSAGSVHKHQTSSMEQSKAEIPKIKPVFTPEQESLLPVFKRQVEKSTLRNLNILYKLENYKKHKLIGAADDALHVFNYTSGNKAARYTLEHALYFIWRLFQEPTKDALDDVKRRMRKISLDEPCFEFSLNGFFNFQTTVFNLCRKNLIRQVRYSLQKREDTKHVCVQAHYHFPQFDGEAHVMMKLWSWRERMYSISQKDSVRRSGARMKPFPDGEFKSMEERVAKWLKDVLNTRIYDYPEALSCDLIYEVKRQLMKRKAHASKQEAVVLIARGWTRNYYHTIEKAHLCSSRPQEFVATESNSQDELMVVDEVYSDESDSDDNVEDLDIEVDEDLTDVQIDLF